MRRFDLIIDEKGEVAPSLKCASVGVRDNISLDVAKYIACDESRDTSYKKNELRY